LGGHQSADSCSKRHFVKQQFLTREVHLADEVWDWEQLFHGFPTSALSFSEEVNCGSEARKSCLFSLPLGFSAGSQLSTELCTPLRFFLLQLLLLLLSQVPRAKESEMRREQAGRLAHRISSPKQSFTLYHQRTRQVSGAVTDFPSNAFQETTVHIIIPATCSA